MPRLTIGPLALLLPAFVGLAGCGGDPAPGSSWVGRTYLLDIPPANWVQPQGIGSDIGDFVPQFLLGVTKGSGADMQITLGTATGGVQDLCSPTTEVAASGGVSYPDVHIGPTDSRLRIVGMNSKAETVVVNTTIHDLVFENVLPGNAPAKDGTFSVTVDASEVYPLFRLLPDATPDSVCAALNNAGAPCAACAFNGRPYCLALRAVQLGAVQATTPVHPVSTSDIPASCSSP